MRLVHYGVATSLDGYIAGPGGEADWIRVDPEIDFAAHYARFDTLLMGRRSFEALGGKGPLRFEGMRAYVCSTTLDPEDHPQVDIVADAASCVRELRAQDGKDIWTWGGGGLFRSLLDAGRLRGLGDRSTRCASYSGESSKPRLSCAYYAGSLRSFTFRRRCCAVSAFRLGSCGSA